MAVRGNNKTMRKKRIAAMRPQDVKKDKGARLQLVQIYKRERKFVVWERQSYEHPADQNENAKLKGSRTLMGQEAGDSRGDQRKNERSFQKVLDKKKWLHIHEPKRGGG